MSVPGIVTEALGDESVAAEVPLGGDDTLYITPTRTLIYRAEGLLSDESIEEYDHDAERLTLSEGRRKTKLTLEYPLEGSRSFTIPSSRADDTLHPVLAGVLNARGVTEPGESVLHTYRFSELTLVITSARLVKHIGAAVWDTEFEEFPYDEVTDLQFEESGHATQVVLTLDGRQERIKAPADVARELREHLTSAVCEHHGVDSIAALRERAEPPEEEQTTPAASAGEADAMFESDLNSLEANPPSVDDPADAAAEAADVLETAGFEPVEDEPEDPPVAADGDDDLAAEVTALREAVERQSEQLERQGELIEQLIQELRRGR